MREQHPRTVAGRLRPAEELRHLPSRFPLRCGYPCHRQPVLALTILCFVKMLRLRTGNRRAFGLWLLLGQLRRWPSPPCERLLKGLRKWVLPLSLITCFLLLSSLLSSAVLALSRYRCCCLARRQPPIRIVNGSVSIRDREEEVQISFIVNYTSCMTGDRQPTNVSQHPMQPRWNKK